MSGQVTRRVDPRRIGEILVERQLVTPRDLDTALRMQAEAGGLIGQALLRLGALTEDSLLSSLQDQLGLLLLDTGGPRPAAETVRAALEATGARPLWLLEHDSVIWLDAREDGAVPVLYVLAAHPLDPALREEVDRWVSLWPAEPVPEVSYALAPSTLLQALLDQLRDIAGIRDEAGDDDDLLDDTARLRELAEEAPVIEFVNTIIANALKERASDIHIEPFEHIFQVRFRLDGVLQLRMTQPRPRFDAVASRIKLMSGMDIGERRLPQDGRQTVRFAGREIDLRVSALPGSWGESLVMRLLEKEAELPDLAGLGITGRGRSVLETLLDEPNGVFLVTGPTGSGKSTTLYRSLELLNDGLRKIITIEDPVEYDMEGVTQIQVRSDIGYTFARGLRSILRQDPDIVLVGEIRDGETAAIAAQAALTGHLVLSTLHTNSALAAVARLVDLGLEPFMIAAAVRGLAAQRLVRRVCAECAEPISSEEGDRLIERAIAEGAPFGEELNSAALWQAGKGCQACSGTGFKGRVALFEIIRFDQRLRDAVLAGRPETELLQEARRSGFLTLMEDGLIKARSGLTTPGEVMRVCGALVDA